MGALRRNADVLRAAIQNEQTGLVAVLKADAYGHGAVACAHALHQKTWGFAVSLVEEGVELRRAGLMQPILTLGCYYGDSHRDVVAYKLTPVVGEARDLARFSRAATELKVSRLGVHLKVDTGMSRLGLRDGQIDDFLTALSQHPNLSLSGLCSHLHDADGPDEKPTMQQLGRLAAAVSQLQKKGLPPGVIHVANTAAAMRFAPARFDLVRAGIGLFGFSPQHTPPCAPWPVMTLRTRIVALRTVSAGETVSYGGRSRLGKNTLCATLPVGYADGYTRRMSERAQVLCGGRRCKVFPPITMDMTMVDVSACPNVQVGDEVVLLGAQTGPEGQTDRISLQEMADWAQTIPWEVCTVISKRVPRVYVE